MERAGQADSACEHWAEGKEIKRGCRVKTEVDKREKKNPETQKKELGRHCRRKKVSMEKHGLRTSPQSKANK